MAIKNGIRKKTVVCVKTSDMLNVDDEVILIELSDDDNGTVEYEVVKHDGNGVKGVGEDTSTKYHGWRGSSHGISIFALGVRRITNVGEVYERSAGHYKYRQEVYKVTVGDDLHPEWE